MKTPRLLTLIVWSGAIAFSACKKDKEETSADQSLSSEIRGGSYSYYRSGSTLTAASPSPHGSFKLKFNATAQTVLDSTGELPTGTSFPNGSVIVKEVISGGGATLLAVMKKDPMNANAGSGWLWAEYNPDGSTVFSVTKKGNGCIGCHSGSPNRDFVRSFDLH